MGERIRSCLCHSAFRLQLLNFGDVDGAPDRACLSRRESNRVGVPIDSPADTIDPTEAQGFVDGLGPGHARVARAKLVEADKKLGLGCSVRFEPIAKGRCVFEEAGNWHQGFACEA
jgi:hypothetical protein